MHFTLKNLGRLEEATIDLGQDLILLTGRNNTSKTYVAHAVYGFFEQSHTIMPLSKLMPKLIPESAVTDGCVEFDVVRSIRENLTAILEELALSYSSNLPDIFATDETFTSHAEIVLRVDAEELEPRYADFVKSDRAILTRGGTCMGRKPAGSPILKFTVRPTPLTEKGISEHSDQRQDQELLAAVRAFAPVLLYEILPSNKSTYILTAERSAIQLFSRELSLSRSELIDDLLAKPLKRGDQELSSMLGRRARRYSLPIRDGLKTADDLATLSKSTSHYAPFAERLERDILQGTVKIGEGGEMRFHPEASQASLEMHLASSSVKSLSPLSFYLRHLAQEGQLLIIDEPELNLHPDNQRHVARLLVRLAHAGLKVMISTHSDYVIREINNAIMLSADTTGALREKYGYEEQDTIRPERVGAYLFDATRARPIPVEPTGISVKSIDEEINRLNQSSQDIYYALFDEPKGV